jgi:hypothetical protein
MNFAAFPPYTLPERGSSMKTFLCVLLVALGLVAAPDANVTGKWSGTAVITGPGGETKDTPALLVLNQTGSEITGTVGPGEGEQHTIKSGKIDGDKITLLVEEEGHVINFALVLSADRIKGDLKISAGDQTMTAKLDVSRAK